MFLQLLNGIPNNIKETFSFDFGRIEFYKPAALIESLGLGQIRDHLLGPGHARGLYKTDLAST